MQNKVLPSLMDYQPNPAVNNLNLHCIQSGMTRRAKKQETKKVTLNKEKNKLMEIYSEMTVILELVFKDTKITHTNMLNDLEKKKQEHNEERNG